MVVSQKVIFNYMLKAELNYEFYSIRHMFSELSEIKAIVISAQKMDYNEISIED